MRPEITRQDELVALVTKIVSKHLKQEEPPPEGSSAPAVEYRDRERDWKIPVSVSNRHVHLSGEHLALLFGADARLTRQKDLSQPGQFACAETVTLVGPQGVIERVRVLGPLRKNTQIEISVSDGVKLGVNAPVRESGRLEGSPGIVLVGPRGAVALEEGCIVADRHIHMKPVDAERLRVKDGDRVSVMCRGPRRLIFCGVLVRVSENYALDMHIDFDEANAALLKNGDLVEIVNIPLT